jgi:hypothetical protein
MSNIGSSTTSTNISSLYSWSATNQTSSRITAQAMANIPSLNSQENADQNQNGLTNTDNNDDNENQTKDDDEMLDSNEENLNNIS